MGKTKMIDEKLAKKILELMHKSGRTLEEALLKSSEELGELVSANFGMKSYKKDGVEHLQEEAIDFLQCAIGAYVLIQEKYPFDGEEIMNKKLTKWEAKYTKQ